jgi:peroxiredoxin
MNQFLWIFMSVMAMSSCSGPEKETSVKDESSAVPAQTVAETASSNYLSGITEANKGSKTGIVHIQGSVRGAHTGQTMYLFETEGKNQLAIDSVKFTNDRFDFPKRSMQSGFYRLALNSDLNSIDFIVSTVEKDLDFSFANSRIATGWTVTGSPENTAWNVYQKEEALAIRTIDNLRKSRSGSAFKERIDKEIEAKEQELVSTHHTYIKNNPGTFLAKYLTWKNPEFPNDKGKYWNDIDFNDESVIRTPIISDRVQSYMIAFSGGTDSGFYNCIDLTKEAADENSAVLEFTLYIMLDGFYQSGKETICLYILDNYIFDEDCGANLTDVIKQRAEGIINLQVGKSPPNFTIRDIKGDRYDLYKEVKKGEYTLVMFWASWCHKCEQEIPVLKNLYSTYKPKGFQVVGVSVDQADAAWRNASEEKGINFPNVSQLSGWKSPVAQDYKVTQTPTLFLLDSEGKIVLKPKRIFEVERFLQENL